MTDGNGARKVVRPPRVTILTALGTPPLVLALRARGIVVTVVDHPGACWSMPVPGQLLVDAERLSWDEVDRRRELFVELQRRGVEVMLATAGLDRLDLEYVEGRAREGKSGGEASVE